MNISKRPAKNSLIDYGVFRLIINKCAIIDIFLIEPRAVFPAKFSKKFKMTFERSAPLPTTTTAYTTAFINSELLLLIIFGSFSFS